ncbi:nitroreductase family protein [Spirosoma luteolum]
MSFIPYQSAPAPDETELLERTSAFQAAMTTRRSIRDFSDRPVSKEVIEQLIMTAASAPSGANKQPWIFCAVSDPALKRRIREAAEAEEYQSYTSRMSSEWLADLAPLGTDWHKPFLETAPWLIVAFRQIYALDGDQKRPNYYVMESVGLACGLLLTAIHQAGLVALAHTPSPMDFLSRLLNRPANEKPFLLIPVGYPAPDALVPDIARKPAQDVVVWY